MRVDSGDEDQVRHAYMRVDKMLWRACVGKFCHYNPIHLQKLSAIVLNYSANSSLTLPPLISRYIAWLLYRLSHQRNDPKWPPTLTLDLQLRPRTRARTRTSPILLLGMEMEMEMGLGLVVMVLQPVLGLGVVRTH